MRKKQKVISADEYKIYKGLLRKPEDDLALNAALGLPKRTARDIRLSRNYRDYKKRIKSKKKHDSLVAKTKFDYIETPPKNVDRELSDRLDREAERTSRIVGWAGVLVAVLFILVCIWGIVKAISGLMACR